MELRLQSRLLAFTRNPIIMQYNVGNDSSAQSVELDMALAPNFHFKGRCTSPAFIDLSDIIEASTPYIDDAEKVSTDNSGLILLEDVDSLSRRTWTIKLSNDGQVVSVFNLLAFPGGVSKVNLRRYEGVGEDIFTSRFCRNDANFFLTTRTDARELVIKETEIAPLYFLNFNGAESLTITQTNTENTLRFEHIGPGIYALDFGAVRRRFCDEFNVLASSFDICRNDIFSCRVLISRANNSAERYRLKFRNSLGVFDIFELTGALTEKTSAEEEDNARYKQFDHITGDFVERRSRIPLATAITASQIINSPSEYSLLRDLIASEEVYLLDYSTEAIRVIPSISELEMRHRQVAPTTISVDLALCEQEMSSILDAADYSNQKNGIFTDQFSMQFS